MARVTKAEYENDIRAWERRWFALGEALDNKLAHRYMRELMGRYPTTVRVPPARAGMGKTKAKP